MPYSADYYFFRNDQPGLALFACTPVGRLDAARRSGVSAPVLLTRRTMKHKIALYFCPLVFLGFLFAAGNATAQTIGYRQTNLSSNLPNVANNVTPGREALISVAGARP